LNQNPDPGLMRMTV